MYYKYDSLNRIYESKLKLNGIGLKTGFVYGNSANTAQNPNLIYGVTLNGSEKLNYRYDNFNRLSTRILNTTTPFVTKYGYLEGASSNETTTLVKTVKNGNTVLEYAYDQLGNITSIKKNGVVIESYEYDSLNQLTRVTNSSGVYVYTYDNGGNILSVTKNGTVIKTYEYIGEDDYDYGNTGWKDLLISFNGEEIYYDSSTTHFYRKYMLTWQNGRQLQSMYSYLDNLSINYAYDGEGDRISKTVGEVTTEFYWLNGILQGQKTGDEHIVFLYDENGTAYGMLVKNGATENYYYYVFNLQGDVIGILDSDGNEVVQYTYDVWGDLLSITGSLADTIGQKNPIRYRGYYYDNETGFYYLQSRYYDPEVGRFINADNVIAGVNGEILGYNQFAYCMNNPVNMQDETGNWPKWVKNTVKWAAKNIVKPAVKTIQKTLSKVDLTYSTGVNVSGTPSAWIFNGQIGVSMDTKGNVAIQTSGGGGITGGDPGISITRYQSVTNAPNIDKLNDEYYQVGGSIAVPIAGVPVAAGGDVMFMPDPELNTGYFGLTGNVGFGTPGMELHVEWGTTVTLTKFNVYELARSVYIKIMEW